MMEKNNAIVLLEYSTILYVFGIILISVLAENNYLLWFILLGGVSDKLINNLQSKTIYYDRTKKNLIRENRTK